MYFLQMEKSAVGEKLLSEKPTELIQ